MTAVKKLAALLMLPSGLALAVAADADKPADRAAPTAAQVGELQKKYEAEHEAVTKDGLAKKFSPEAIAQAESLAKKGKEALAEGRLLQARVAYREARWLLPALPPGLPKNVTRILGSNRLRHAGDVNGIAYSADGRRLATAGADGTVKVWDLANGHELVTYRGHKDAVRAVAFSADGKTVASAGEPEVRLWDARTGNDIKTLKWPEKKKAAKDQEEEDYLTRVAFSPNGKLVASGGSRGVVCLHEVDSGNLKRTLDPQPGQDQKPMIAGLAYGPDGKQVAALLGNGFLHVWDPADGEHLLGIEGQRGSGYDLGYSHDGNLIVTCGGSGARLHRAPVRGTPNTTEPVRDVPPPGDLSFKCVALSGDGKVLAAACRGEKPTDNVIRLYDTDSGEQAGLLPGHLDEINALGFRPGHGELASASSDHTVRLWQTDAGQGGRDLAGSKGAVWAAAFRPDGKRVVSGGADRLVRIWDPVAGGQVKELKGHRSAITTVLYSPDGKTILSCGGDKVIRLWGADSGELRHTLKGHHGTITAAAFSPDGKKIVSGGADRLVIVWDADQGGELHTLKDCKAVVAAVAFDPDGKRVAAGAVDQTITVWDAGSGKRKSHWSAGAPVAGLAYSPNGSWLASCGGDNLIRLWKPSTPSAPPVTLAGHNGAVSSVAFTTDSRLLASGGADQLVKVWQVEGDSAKEARSLRGHKDWVSSVAFSKDGHYLVSASVDKLVKVWELTRREATAAPGHNGEVTALAVSPDGKLLASGGADTTVKLWDLKTGALRHTLAGHPNPISSLAFTPDGQTLVSGSAPGSGTPATPAVKLWDVDAGKEREGLKELDITRNVPALSVTPDGKHLLIWVPGATNDKNPARSFTTVLVCDLTTGKQVGSFNDQGRSVNCLAFSADGKRAAIGAKDGSVRLYDLTAKGGERAPGGDWPVTTKEVGDLIFTPNGKKLLTGDSAGDVKIWDVAKRDKPLHELKKAHKDRIVAFAMSPDGKRFATTSVDNTVKVWDLETGQELRKWAFNWPVQQSASFVRNLVFTPRGKALVTANADTTIYQLELPEKKDSDEKKGDD